MPGFDTLRRVAREIRADISSAREFGDLPKAARKYVQMIEEVTAVEVSLVSVGPDRNQTIIRRNPFRA